MGCNAVSNFAANSVFILTWNKKFSETNSVLWRNLLNYIELCRNYLRSGNNSRSVSAFFLQIIIFLCPYHLIAPTGHKKREKMCPENLFGELATRFCQARFPMPYLPGISSYTSYAFAPTSVSLYNIKKRKEQGAFSCIIIHSTIYPFPPWASVLCACRPGPKIPTALIGKSAEGDRLRAGAWHQLC